MGSVSRVTKSAKVSPHALRSHLFAKAGSNIIIVPTRANTSMKASANSGRMVTVIPPTIR